MAQLVFFYGTLMSPFNRTAQLQIQKQLIYRGHGTITGALFDLGIYPAAIPASDARVRGEVYEILPFGRVLDILDELEGYSPDEPESSLYTRTLTHVTLDDGSRVQAWVYFYNAPLGRAVRIDSGDYLEHLRRPMVEAAAS